MDSTLISFIPLLLIGLGFQFFCVGETLLRMSGRVHILNFMFNIIGMVSVFILVCVVGYFTYKYHWYWILLGIGIIPAAFTVNSIFSFIMNLLFSSLDRYERGTIIGNIYYPLSFACYSVGYYGLYDLIFS